MGVTAPTSVLLDGVVFEANHARGEGGAMEVTASGDLEVDATTASFIDNASDSHGAAAYLSAYSSASTVWRGGTFERNTAGNSDWRGDGGALYSTGRFLDVIDAVFVDNFSNGFAGAIGTNFASPFRGEHNVVIDGCTFIRNEAETLSGGAVDLGMPSQLLDNVFLHNRSVDGGAVSAYGWGSLAAYADGPMEYTFEGNEWLGNRAADAGGALFVTGGAEVSVDGDRVAGNTAPLGGGVFIDEGIVDFVDTELGTLPDNRGGDVFIGSLGESLVGFGEVTSLSCDGDTGCSAAPPAPDCDDDTAAYCVDPDATASRWASLGAGSYLMADAVVRDRATLADSVLIGTDAQVDYDSVLGSNSQIGKDSVVRGRAELGAFVVAGNDVSVGYDAVVGDHVWLGNDVVLRDRSEVGDGAIIGADAEVGYDVRIGADAVLGENVTLRDRVVIGAGARIEDGVVLDYDEVVAAGEIVRASR